MLLGWVGALAAILTPVGKTMILLHHCGLRQTFVYIRQMAQHVFHQPMPSSRNNYIRLLHLNFFDLSAITVSL